jgi:hypothetical protein
LGYIDKLFTLIFISTDRMMPWIFVDFVSRGGFRSPLSICYTTLIIYKLEHILKAANKNLTIKLYNYLKKNDIPNLLLISLLFILIYRSRVNHSWKGCLLNCLIEWMNSLFAKSIYMLYRGGFRSPLSICYTTLIIYKLEHILKAANKNLTIKLYNYLKTAWKIKLRSVLININVKSLSI